MGFYLNKSHLKLIKDTMYNHLVLICLILATLSFCNGQTVQVHCGNNITISVEGTADFPVDVTSDIKSNATGLVAGYTEYCDANGVSPPTECKFTKDTSRIEVKHTLVIEDFTSCDISRKYIADDDVTEVTVLVSRIPYVNSTMIRRSECGRFAVMCRYNKTLENVTFDTSVNITAHDYVGVNSTVNSTTEAQLFLVDDSFVDVVDGTTYNLTERVHVEARVVNNTDKFVSVLLNCWASKTDDYNDDYTLIRSDGCANPDDSTIEVDCDNPVPASGAVEPRAEPHFRFGAFVWTTLENVIYVRCDMQTCLDNDAACIASMTKCSGSKLLNRFRRNAENLKTTTVKSGAITVQKLNAVNDLFTGYEN